jgi:hypothetical protein
MEKVNLLPSKTALVAIDLQNLVISRTTQAARYIIPQQTCVLGVDQRKE